MPNPVSSDMYYLIYSTSLKMKYILNKAITDIINFPNFLLAFPNSEFSMTYSDPLLRIKMIITIMYMVFEL